MRRRTSCILGLACALTCLAAWADLQNVTVGGEVRVRGNWWTSPASPDSVTSRNPYFQPPWTDSFRAVGTNPLRFLRWPAQPGRQAVFSPVDWSDAGPSTDFVEQRTKLNLSADFTDHVNAFIELDSYDVWGTDFRSNYITGADASGATGDDVEIYQAYIEASEMWGTPLKLRVGRQELKFGSGWFVGTNDAAAFARGLSFDALRLTYATDLFSVDAVASKLVENGAVEEDGDVDFYTVYGSFLGIENHTIDAYWMMVRDARSINDTNNTWPGEWLEDVVGVDDYDPTTLHTVGLRGAGLIGAFDYELEAAYQFGNADAVSSLFAGSGLRSPYGTNGDDFDTWAANAMVGYTFKDMAWAPRPFLCAAYFGGEDNRDVSVLDWARAVFSPFYRPEPSISFNRLFSDWQYSNWPDAPNHDLTNCWLACLGVVTHPTDTLTVVGSVAHVETLNAYHRPWPVLPLFGMRFTPLGFWSFLDRENDKELCWDISLKAIYAYSEALTFEAGWSHLFVEDGLSQGSFNIGNGLTFEGGVDDDDADYFYFDTKLKF